MSPTLLTPGQQTRENDLALEACSKVLQDHEPANLGASRGITLHKFPLKKGHGRADFLLFVDGHAVDAFDVKQGGNALSSVEPQASRDTDGLPRELDTPVRPLPFVGVSTGVASRFTRLDRDPWARPISAVFVPQILATNSRFT